MNKYTKEVLFEAVQQNKSFAGVLRSLGCKLSGGMQSYVRRLVKKFEIDTSHFLGQAINRGRIFDRKPAQKILVAGAMTSARMLRRALLEIGRPYICAKCGLGAMWQDFLLVLEVHHKDGNRENNKEFNLDFLCPNCHSQTINYGAKKLLHPSGGMHTQQS